MSGWLFDSALGYIRGGEWRNPKEAGVEAAGLGLGPPAQGWDWSGASGMWGLLEVRTSTLALLLSASSLWVQRELC